MWNRKLWCIPAVMIPLHLFQILDLFLPNTTSPLQTEISNWYIGFLPSLVLSSGRFRAVRSWVGMPIEFLVSRAIDRRILYRSMVTLFYLAVLIVPVSIFLFSKNLDARVYIYAGESPEPCLSHVAGSSLLPPPKHSFGQQLILIPNGTRLFAQWRLWFFLVAMSILQFFVLLQFKPFDLSRHLPGYEHFLFGLLWRLLFTAVALFGGLVMIVVFLLVFSGLPLFYAFAAHQTVFWLLTVPALILGQFCCERLFARLEQ